MINDSRFEWKDVLSGICTATCLIVKNKNSMPNTFKSKLYIFTDKAKLYREITSGRDVELLQDDLRKLEELSKSSLLLFNEDNYGHMMFSYGKSNRDQII